MTIFTILVGAVTWIFLDHFQSRELSLLFRHEIDQALSKKARVDRSLFDSYIKSYSKAAAVITAQKRFVDYVEENDSLTLKDNTPLQHNVKPLWLPKNSIMRTFPIIQHLLIIDDQGRLLESYSLSGTSFPSRLVQNSLIRQLSHDQTLLTNVEELPYILVSEPIYDERNEHDGSLILACPLDDNFLHSAVSIIAPDSRVALVDNKNNRIVSSNVPDDISAGDALSTIIQNYHITGKSFFDYGSSDLDLKFISLLARSTYDQIVTRILLTGRINGLILSISLIFSFLIVSYWITIQVHNLTRQVIDFSNTYFTATSKKYSNRDQLATLKERFEWFTREILYAQNKIKEQAEENLALTRQRYEVKQREDILYLLQTITEILGLGIITHDEEKGAVPANKEMGRFIDDCGEIERFTMGGLGNFEIELPSRTGLVHIFQIHTRYFSGKQKITLVQDITKKKNHEGEREQLITELTDALDRVNTLGGFLPICSSCKKIRDDQGDWCQLESYFKRHLEVEFSHSICPDCSKTLYADIDIIS